MPYYYCSQSKLISDSEAGNSIASTPVHSDSESSASSDDDDLSMPEWIRSRSKGTMRKNKAWIQRLAQSALALPPTEPEPKRQPTPLTSPANSDDEGVSEDQRRMANKAKRMAQKGTPKGTAQGTGRKNPTEEAKASHPMVDHHPVVTRRQEASRAGGLRSGGGSGKTDTRVASGNPSKT
jgi:hypothetical protein